MTDPTMPRNSPASRRRNWARASPPESDHRTTAVVCVYDGRSTPRPCWAEAVQSTDHWMRGPWRGSAGCGSRRLPRYWCRRWPAECRLGSRRRRSLKGAPRRWCAHLRLQVRPARLPHRPGSRGPGGREEGAAQLHVRRVRDTFTGRLVRPTLHAGSLDGDAVDSRHLAGEMHEQQLGGAGQVRRRAMGTHRSHARRSPRASTQASRGWRCSRRSPGIACRRRARPAPSRDRWHPRPGRAGR